LEKEEEKIFSKKIKKQIINEDKEEEKEE